MNTIKPWWRSRTLVGALVTLIALLLRESGVIDLSDAEQQSLVDAVLGAAEVSGLGLVAWGRSVAGSRLTLGTAPGGNGDEPRTRRPGPIMCPPGAVVAAVAFAAMLMLSGCVSANPAAGALDAAGGGIDTAIGIGEGVVDRLYAREVGLICKKTIRAHAQAISAGVMSAKALPLLCPEVDAFVSTIQGAR